MYEWAPISARDRSHARSECVRGILLKKLRHRKCAPGGRAELPQMQLPLRSALSASNFDLRAYERGDASSQGFREMAESLIPLRSPGR